MHCNFDSNLHHLYSRHSQLVTAS